jgi:hypothetical protein
MQKKQSSKGSLVKKTFNHECHQPFCRPVPTNLDQTESFGMSLQQQLLVMLLRVFNSLWVSENIPLWQHLLQCHAYLHCYAHVN